MTIDTPRLIRQMQGAEPVSETDLRSLLSHALATQRMLTTAEVADRLCVHINTVKRIHPLDLPFYRIVARGDRRYRRVDVEQYLANRLAGRLP